VLLLENDRVRVHETALPAGAGDQARARGDCATFVIDGARVRVVAADADGGERVVGEDDRASLSPSWTAGAGMTRLLNVGTTAYRELSVELK
jgi:hypothetical protein